MPATCQRVEVTLIRALFSDSCFSKDAALEVLHSGKRKVHKPKILGLDVFRWGGHLPREGGGSKSSVCPPKPKHQTFGPDVPGLSPGFLGVAKKFEKNSLSSILVPYTRLYDQLLKVLWSEIPPQPLTLVCHLQVKKPKKKKIS